jgi:hypothetical protein
MLAKLIFLKRWLIEFYFYKGHKRLDSFFRLVQFSYGDIVEYLYGKRGNNFFSL